MNSAFIKQGARILRLGGLVVFPTETVYGLGADAFNEQAVAKIFRAKRRPADNPLIVHIARLQDIKKIARDIPPQALLLAKRFWPGPLTLILPKKAGLPKMVTGQTDTVAVRMPDHPIALALIKAAGRPIAAPSANLSGRPSATDIAHAVSDFGDKVNLHLDAGPAKIGLESTVLDLTSNPPEILRPGSITKEMLQKLLGRVRERGHGHLHKVRSPGMKYRHYAPKARLVLLCGSPQTMVKKALALIKRYKKTGKKIGIIASRETSARYTEADHVATLGSRNSLREVASKLFRALRAFDDQRVDIIIAEAFPEKGIGRAVMNRLRKAATRG